MCVMTVYSTIISSTGLVLGPNTDADTALMMHTILASNGMTDCVLSASRLKCNRIYNLHIIYKQIHNEMRVKINSYYK